MRAKKSYPFKNGIIKDYPYPSRKNPVRLSPLADEAQEQLRELAKKR